MLAELRIKDYALIDDLRIELDPGLNVLSGETGAGKSIVVGALSLLLGDKPDADMIRSGADTAQVEGRFRVNERLATEIREIGVQTTEDAADQLLLRRRAERGGRGAAYANDSGVTAASLRRLGDRLVDLHGQHQHQLLLRPETHLDILDEYAGLRPERQQYAERFRAFEQDTTELVRIDKELAERRARRELTEFQLNELREAQVKPGELEELGREREQLQTAERRFTLARQLEGLLSEQEGSIIGLLGAASKALADLTELDPNMEKRRAVLTETEAEADDLWRELVRYRENIEFSPDRLDAINSRLYQIEKLERKYGLRADELPKLRTQLEAELESIETGDSRRKELATELEGLKRTLTAEADELSRKRGRARSELEKKLQSEFRALGLDKARLSVAITRVADPSGVYERGGERFRLTLTGVDVAEFLFSANAGEELRPLRKVASGGELSRIMLALKSVLSKADPVPTLVFDEIDVGIGGRVAEAVGRRLARLAKTHQVICITHLPQIAKYADLHLLVAKSVRGSRTLTSIRTLDADSRVSELARMTSGTTVTRAGLAHAREMLGAAGTHDG